LNRKKIFGLTTVILAVVVGAWLFLKAAGQSTYDVEQISDLSYDQGGQSYFHLLDLYLPKGTGLKKLPVVIWIHGGAWRYGDKKDTPAVAFAQRGYAVASLNYRLSDNARFPAQIKDCKAAIRWLRAHASEYNLNPNKFAAFGMSAGGHLVALLGVTNNYKQFDDLDGNQQCSSSVQAVCDWCGPTDMFTLQKQAKGNSQLDWEGPQSPLAIFLGGSPEKVPELAGLASPITFVKEGDPPFLIMHGDQDEIVPLAQSQELYEALKKAKVDVQLIKVKGGAHNFASSDNFGQVLNFFAQKLK